PSRVAEDAERIVYEESQRALSQQREVLDALRARAGTLLGAASIATAFLSAQALPNQLDWLAWTAIILFCLVVLLALCVLIPWGWTFAHHPHLLIGVHLEAEAPPQDWRPSTLSEIYRNISYWNGVHYDENGRKLHALLWLFAVGGAAEQRVQFSQSQS